MIRSKRFWFGLVITLVSLFLAFQGIQLSELLGAFSEINWLWLGPLVAAFWLSYAGRVFRWQTLFQPYHPRWIRVLGTLSVGYFLSNIVPLRIGDLVRAYLIGKLESIPVAWALSTVVVERTLDGLTIVLYLTGLLFFVPAIPAAWRNAGLVLGLTGIAVLVFLGALSYYKERGIALLRRLTARIRILQREIIWRVLGNLIQGFAVVRSPRPLVGAILWSIWIWFFACVLSWFMMFAMGMNLPFTAAVVVQVVTALAVTVAPSPGQLGVFHLAVVVGLTSLFGVGNAQALAYAFAVHGFVYLWLMGLGIFFAWQEGLDLAQISEIQSRAAVNPASAENSRLNEAPDLSK